MKKRLQSAWHITKETVKKFTNDTPLDYAATISFYTIFSLPAVLIIMIRIAATALGKEAVTGQLVSQLSGIVGQKSAEQIQSIIENANQSEATGIGTFVGVATMIFTSTTVFIALQDSLNAMWAVKAKPRKGWVKLIVNRLISAALIVSFGFLLLVTLLSDVVLGVFSDYIRAMFSDSAAFFINAGQLVFSLLVSIVIFATIFKVLPDAKVPWRSTWIGATVTAVLFVAGKYLINLYLQYDPLADSYGAAASLVLLLVWVYYAAVVFLLGAEFTQVYALEMGHAIQPSEHAVRVRVEEIESEK